MKNKYPGECMEIELDGHDYDTRQCETRVAPGEGTVARNASGDWITRCARHSQVA